MVQSVNVPGVGTLQFPDGMSQPDMAAAIKKNYPNLSPANPTEGMSTADKLFAGAGSEFVRMGNRLRQLTATGVQGTNPETGQGDEEAQKANIANVQSDIDEHAKLDKPLMATGAGQVGAALPGGLAMIPTGGSVAGAAAVGAGLGALQPTQDGDSGLKNVALGAASGAAGSLVGKLVGAGITAGASKLTDVASQAVDFLKSKGITLSLGQMTGRDIGQTAGAAFQQAKDYTRAAMRYMGIDSDVASMTVMNAGRKVLKDTYDDIASRTTITFDNQLADRLTNLEKLAGDNLTAPEAAIITKQIGRIRNLAQSDPTQASPLLKINGTALQNLRESVGAISGDGGKQPFVNGLDDALSDAMKRSASPQDAALLAQTNQRYGAMKAIEKAVGDDNRIKPADLYRATDTKQGANASVYGQGPNAELAQLGQAGSLVMKPTGATADASHVAQEVAKRVAVGSVLGYGGYHHGGAGEGLLGIAAVLGGPAMARAVVSNPQVAAALTKYATSQGWRTAADAIAARAGVAAGGAAIGPETTSQ